MALSRTDIGFKESSSNYGTGSFATNSFTPAANSLLLVIVHFMGQGTTGDLGTPTISGGGLTYTAIANAIGQSSWSFKTIAFYALVGSSPSSMTITVDDDNNQSIYAYTVAVHSFTGHDTSTPIVGSISSGTTNIGDGAETQTLGATPTAEDVTVSVISGDAEKGPMNPTLTAGWTKVYDLKNGGESGFTDIFRTGSTSNKVEITDVYTGGSTLFKGAMFSFIIKAGKGSNVVEIGIASEVNFSQSFGRLKTKLIGRATETDSAQACLLLKTKALSQTSENNFSQSFVHQKTQGVSIVSETDQARSIDHLKISSLSRATETDSAPAFSKLKLLNLSRASENDLAQSLVWAPKQRLLHQVEEIDLSRSFTHVISATINFAAEVDISSAMSKIKTGSIGRAEEIDHSSSIGRVTTQTMGVAIEIDSSRSLGHSKTIALGQASSSNEAGSILPLKFKSIEPAIEIDSAQMLSPMRVVSLGMASEANSSMSFNRSKTKNLGMTLENDSASTFTTIKKAVMGRAVELNIARRIIRLIPEKRIILDTVAVVLGASDQTLVEVQTGQVAKKVSVNVNPETEVVIEFGLTFKNAQVVPDPQASIVVPISGLTGTTVTVLSGLNQSSVMAVIPHQTEVEPEIHETAAIYDNE